LKSWTRSSDPNAIQHMRMHSVSLSARRYVPSMNQSPKDFKSCLTKGCSQGRYVVTSDQKGQPLFHTNLQRQAAYSRWQWKVGHYAHCDWPKKQLFCKSICFANEVKCRVWLEVGRHVCGNSVGQLGNTVVLFRTANSNLHTCLHNVVVSDYGL